MNILISGIAGDIGFGAGRILREWGWAGKLFGIDVQTEHPGEFVFDRQAVAPRASGREYILWLENYINCNDIDLFIPTSEAEITLLNDEGFLKIGKARILAANKKSIYKSIDKSACMAYLADQGIRVPINGVVGSRVPLSYPVIVKPRSGQGSKQIQRFDDANAFIEYAPMGHVWQEYLQPDDQEYTCPVYRSAERETRVLVLRRSLAGGLTSRGEVVYEPSIENYVLDIARALDLDGSINVQLRLTEDGPCLFEINPRLSSTLVFRHKMGFSDLCWWIQDTVGKDHTPRIPPYQPPLPGTRFFRGAQEYIAIKSI